MEDEPPPVEVVQAEVGLRVVLHNSLDSARQYPLPTPIPSSALVCFRLSSLVLAILCPFLFWSLLLYFQFFAVTFLPCQVGSLIYVVL